MSSRVSTAVRRVSKKTRGNDESPKLIRELVSNLKVAEKPDPEASAKEGGLRYVSDASPGITRRKVGKGFTYIRPDGTTVEEEEDLVRIRSLAIPPAWTDVWICPLANGHIQAVGRDDRGRKQYRYHPKWHEVRDETKYGRMIAFVHALPRIRRRVQRDLAKPGLPREKVLAAIVRLLETTLIRVGNEEYAAQNKSFGLTTFRDRHADVSGSTVRFRFRGKSGVQHDIDIQDRRVAKIVKQCQDLPGQELLQYIDEEENAKDIASNDVNEYLKEISGQDFTAKDFRTWAGTVLAAQALQEFEQFDSQAKAKKNIVAAVERVAMKLGNTRAVCRKCYIHPAVIDSYMDGELLENLDDQAREMIKSVQGLGAEEAAVLVMLQKRLMAQRRRQKKHRNGTPPDKLEATLAKSVERATRRRVPGHRG